MPPVVGKKYQGSGFAAVLASIRSALVCPSEIVKDHGVDRGWAESGQLQVVGPQTGHLGHVVFEAQAAVWSRNTAALLAPAKERRSGKRPDC